MPPLAIPLEPAELFDAASRLAQEGGNDLWVVGGYVRDALLGRPAPDIDLCAMRPKQLAKRLAAALEGGYIELDADFGIYRVTTPSGVTIDLARLQAETLEADLMARDLTINALALPLVVAGQRIQDPQLIDPTGGEADLRDGRIRTPHVDNLLADPVRMLRVLRFAATLGFAIDHATLLAVEKHKRLLLESAHERLTLEVFKILGLDSAYVWIERLYGLGLLSLLIPELGLLERLPAEHQARNAMLQALETCRQLEGLLGEVAMTSHEALSRTLDEPLSPGITSRALLKLAALLLEVGRPFALHFDPQGETTFDPHGPESARRAGAIAVRFKLSSRARVLLESWCRSQDSLEALSHAPADPVGCYRLFKDAKSATPGLVLLAIARARALATPPAELARFEAALHQILAAFLDPEARLTAPRRLLDGQTLMRELALKPGPEVGRLLEATLEAQLRGEVSSQAQAIAYAQARLGALEDPT